MMIFAIQGLIMLVVARNVSVTMAADNYWVMQLKGPGVAEEVTTARNYTDFVVTKTYNVGNATGPWCLSVSVEEFGATPRFWGNGTTRAFWAAVYVDGFLVSTTGDRRWQFSNVSQAGWRNATFQAPAPSWRRPRNCEKAYPRDQGRNPAMYSALENGSNGIQVNPVWDGSCSLVQNSSSTVYFRSVFAVNTLSVRIAADSDWTLQITGHDEVRNPNSPNTSFVGNNATPVPIQTNYILNGNGPWRLIINGTKRIVNGTLTGNETAGIWVTVLLNNKLISRTGDIRWIVWKNDIDQWKNANFNVRGFTRPSYMNDCQTKTYKKVKFNTWPMIASKPIWFSNCSAPAPSQAFFGLTIPQV